MRQRARDERRAKFEKFLQAVLRLQAIYKRHKLAEERERQRELARLNGAAAVLQRFIKDRLAIWSAKAELERLRVSEACVKSLVVPSESWLGHSVGLCMR
jgi:hypothetical protein